MSDITVLKISAMATPWLSTKDRGDAFDGPDTTTVVHTAEPSIF
jgi:hypothetical protein